MKIKFDSKRLRPPKWNFLLQFATKRMCKNWIYMLSVICWCLPTTWSVAQEGNLLPTDTLVCANTTFLLPIPEIGDNEIFGWQNVDGPPITDFDAPILITDTVELVLIVQGDSVFQQFYTIYPYSITNDLQLPDTITLCEGGAVTLTTGIEDAILDNFIWESSNAEEPADLTLLNPTVSPTNNTVYYFTVNYGSDSSLACTITDSVFVEVMADGTGLDLELNFCETCQDIVCVNEMQTIEATPGFDYYIWTTNTGDTIAEGADVTSFTVENMDFVNVEVISGDCMTSANIAWTLLNIPLPVLSANPPLLCEGDTTTITILNEIDVSEESFTITWMNSETGQIIQDGGTSLIVTESGSYYVEVMELLANCINISDSITIESFGNIDFAPITEPIFVDTAPFNMEVTPAGGTFSGTGITDTELGTFTPPNSDVTEEYIITYTITDEDNVCMVSADTTIVVLASTEIVEIDPLPTEVFCALDTALYSLSATPTGGVWSVEINEDGTFVPSELGAGIYIATYTFESQTASIDIFIEGAVEAQAFVNLCEGDTFILPSGDVVTTDTTAIYMDIANCTMSETIITIFPEFNDTLEVSFCEGESYTTGNGEVLTEEGMYTFVLGTDNGCDSIVNINVEILTPYFDEKEVEICQGETYTLIDGTEVSFSETYTIVTTASNGCDSVVVVNLIANPTYTINTVLSVCQGDSLFGVVYNTVIDTAYVDSLLTVNGCDSIITNQITVNPTYNTVIDTTICGGESYELPDGTLVTTSSVHSYQLLTQDFCDSTTVISITVEATFTETEEVIICSGETYTLVDGTEVSVADTYTASVPAINGCDSTVTTILLVQDAPELLVQVIACQGEEYTLPDNETIVVNEDTTITTLLTGIGDCDTTVVTEIIMLPTITDTIFASICEGDTYILPNGDTVALAVDVQEYEHFVPIGNGCNNTITTILTVHPTYSDEVIAEICGGEVYFGPDDIFGPNDIELTTGGIYLFNPLTVNGCDSTITLTLTVHPNYTNFVEATICEGETFIAPNEEVLTMAGTYEYPDETVHGCDSLLTVVLNVEEMVALVETSTVCAGDDYELPNGSVLTLNVDTTITTIIAGAICDTTVETTITVLPNYNIVIDTAICSTDTYILPNGQVAMAGGEYVYNYSALTVCDSIITVNLTIESGYESFASVEICEGESIELPDGTLFSDTAGAYMFTHPFATENNCDSILNTIVTIHPVLMDTIDVTICEGETYTMPNDEEEDQPAEYIFYLLTDNNCSNTVVVNLTVHPSYTMELDTTICSNTPYILPNGQEANTTGTYIIEDVSTIYGCDSSFVIHVTVEPSFALFASINNCYGDSYELPDGTEVSDTVGIHEYVISINEDGVGCDSLFVTTINVLPSYAEVINETICEGGEYEAPNGDTLTIAGEYSYEYNTQSGCDSTITVNLTVEAAFFEDIVVTICSNETYIMPDGNPAVASGFYTYESTTVNGCLSATTVDLTIIPSITTTIEESICEGEEYTLPTWMEIPPNIVSPPAGEYEYEFSFVDTAGNCPSVIITLLTVHPVYEQTEEVVICENTNYLLPNDSIASEAGLYTSALETIHGCDSIIHTNIIVEEPMFEVIDTLLCAGQTYMLPSGQEVSAAGTYTYLYPNVGCGSTLEINITIAPSYIAFAALELCEGESYELPGGVIVTPTPGVWEYTHIFPLSNGCDSTINTTLTINASYTNVQDTLICFGEEYEFPDGSVATTSTLYIDSLLSVAQCDSVEIINLIVEAPYEQSITLNICEGDSLNGVFYEIPNTVTLTDTVSSINGCDSVYNITIININPIFKDTVYVSICEGDVYEAPDGQTPVNPGDYLYVENFQSSMSCDSIVTTMLTIYPNYITEIDASICVGESFEGVTYDMGGFYDVEVNDTSIYGCDSTIMVTLHVSGGITQEQSVEICQWSEYAGIVYTTVGDTVLINTLMQPNGCVDTLVTTLTVHPTSHTTISSSICQGESYNGEVYEEAGMDTIMFISQTNQGCNDTLVVELTIHPSSFEVIDTSICAGEIYLLPNDSIAITNGLYEYNFPTLAGCDSSIIVNLTVYPTYESIEEVQICEEALYNGMTYEAGSYTLVDTVPAINGCDSISTVLLTVGESILDTIETTACDNEVDITSLTPRPDLGPNVHESIMLVNVDGEGCDTILTTIITVFESYMYETEQTPCVDNLPYTLDNGIVIDGGGEYIYTGETVNGCDSIVYINVLVDAFVTYSYPIDVCEGGVVTLPDSSATAAFSEEQLFVLEEELVTIDSSAIYEISLDCETRVELNVTFHQPDTLMDTIMACLGEMVVLPDSTEIIAETDSTTYTSTVAGEHCDDVVMTTVLIAPAPSITLEDTLTIDAGMSIQLGLVAEANSYTYQWTPAESLDNPSFANPTAAPLDTTTYYVTVTDPASGCFVEDSILVMVSPQVELSASATCELDSTGANTGNMVISLEAFDGVEPYIYTTLDGTELLNGAVLPADSIVVIVTDSIGTTDTSSVVMTCSVINMTFVYDCNTPQEGTADATLSINGNTPPYTIAITTLEGDSVYSAESDTAVSIPFPDTADSTIWLATITDAAGYTITDSLSIDCSEAFNVIIANPDTIDMEFYDDSATIEVLANDYFPSDVDSVSISIVNMDTTAGIFSIDTASLTITFTPFNNTQYAFVGETTLTYIVQDTMGLIDSAEVVFNVACPNPIITGWAVIDTVSTGASCTNPNLPDAPCYAVVNLSGINLEGEFEYWIVGIDEPNDFKPLESFCVPKGTDTIVLRHQASGCLFEEAFTVEGCTTITSVSEPISSSTLLEQVVISPNPSTGLVNVTNLPSTEATHIQVFSMLGQQVYAETLRPQTPTTTLDLQHLSEGVYLLHLETAGSRSVQKLEIMR